MGRKVGKARASKSKRPGRHTQRAGGRYGQSRARALRVWEMLTLSDHSDEDGRLLLEDSAPEKALAAADRAGVPRTTSVSTYLETPSRASGLMNEAAYEALRRDTAEILNGFAWLTLNYLELFPNRKATVQTVEDVSHLGLSLPLVLMGKAHDPIPKHGSLPSYLASIFKASRGVFSAAVDLANKKGSETKITAREIVAFADEEGHFRRAQTNRVCAAPTRLIERTLAVILTGEGANPEKTSLGHLIEFAQLWEFYSVEAVLNDALSRYGFVLNKVLATSGAGDPEALFGLMVPDGEGLRPLGLLTEDILRQVNLAQAKLNELLGRSKDAPKITFNDLLKLI